MAAHRVRSKADVMSQAKGTKDVGSDIYPRASTEEHQLSEVECWLRELLSIPNISIDAKSRRINSEFRDPEPP
jgi:hypothetical protein